MLLRSLREGIDYSTANGRMVAGICADPFSGGDTPMTVVDCLIVDL